MGTGQLVVLLTSQGLLLVTLAGLWWRRRIRRLWLLPVSLLVVAVAQALEYGAPRVFFGWRFWAARELLLHAITLGILGEIAWRAFAMVAEARKRARRWIAGTLLLTLAVLVLIPWHTPEYAGAPWVYVMVAEVLPRLAGGAAVMGLAVGFAMYVASLPLDPLHGAVWEGLTAYLILYAVVRGVLPQHADNAWLDAATPVGYTLTLAWWAWAAWRNEPPEGTARARRLVHPWREDPDAGAPDVVP